MTLNRIAKYLRQMLGKIASVDPEQERVIAALLERLEDHGKWHSEGYKTIIHKELNIKVTYDNIENPAHVWVPFRWKSHVQEHIDIVVRNDKVNTLNFVHDVVSGRYLYQVRLTHGCGYEDWLQENDSSDDYFIHNHWIYFLSEETAMGFKLALQ